MRHKHQSNGNYGRNAIFDAAFLVMWLFVTARRETVLERDKSSKNKKKHSSKQQKSLGAPALNYS